MKKFLLLLPLLGGCKASEMAQIRSMGSKHEVTCYSGGVSIYHGESAGNVSNESQSDGWYWEDVETGKLVESSAACIFKAE